jgi:hypothetical protein
LVETVFRPIAGLLLVGFVPGLLLERILRPGRPALDRMAVAPTLGCATVFLYFRLAAVVSVSVSPAAFFVLLTSLVLLAVWRSTRHALPAITPGPHDGRSLERVFAAGMLGMAVVVGGVIWLHGIPDHLSVPPNHDSMNHGFMAARISDTGSLEPSRVLVTDLQSRQPVTAFYPLGLHVVAALAHRITGANLSDILWWIVVLAGAVCLPIGIFTLTRRFFPEDPLAAGAAAVLSILIPLFPYKPIAWGGIALILGMALTPGVVVALEWCADGVFSIRAVAIAVLALIGLLVVHTSEIPLAVLLVGVLVLHRAPRIRHWPYLRERAIRLATIGAVFVVVAVPLAAKAMQDRALPDNPAIPWGRALSDIAHLQVSVAVGQRRIAVLAAAGAAVLLWRRRPWLVLALGVLLGLYLVAASSTNQTLRAFTSPWYRQSERIAYVVAPLAAILGGLALAAVARTLGNRAPGTRAAAIMAGVMTVTGVFLAGVHLPGPTSDILHREIGAYSAVGTDELAAFRFVQRQRTPLAVLGDEMGDGSIWMYALAGVAPVFGMKPPLGSDLFRTWEERLFVAEHLNDSSDRTLVDPLLAKYCIGFIYYTDHHLYGATDLLDLKALEANHELEEAFRSGSARVFRVKNARCTQATEVREPS